MCLTDYSNSLLHWILRQRRIVEHLSFFRVEQAKSKNMHLSLQVEWAYNKLFAGHVYFCLKFSKLTRVGLDRLTYPTLNKKDHLLLLVSHWQRISSLHIFALRDFFHLLKIGIGYLFFSCPELGFIKY